MTTSDAPDPENRRKTTVWLFAGGAASLLIPLAGAFYLHWSQNAGSNGPSGRADVFERREGQDRKLMPTQTAVVMSPSSLTVPTGLPAGGSAKPAASSLDFIQSNADMRAGVADQKPAVPAPAVSTAPAEAAAAAPVKKGGKAGKKPFVMPKLQPSRGFTNFGSTGSKGAANTGAQTGAGGNPGTQDILKNLPPGSENNPQVQAYLKSQQGQ